MELLPPIRGASDVRPFIKQAGSYAAAPSTIQNVRVRARGKNRRTMGPRDGIVQTFPTAIGNGGAGAPVQLLANVTRASGTVYSTGPRVLGGAGESKTAGVLKGQAWVLGTNLAMQRSFQDVTARDGGAYACAWHQDGVRFAFGTIFSLTSPSRWVSRVNMCNADTGAILWSTTLEDMDAGGSLPATPRDRYINSIFVGSLLTFCSVGGYVYILRTTDGVYLRRYSLSNWAWETQHAIIRPDGYLAVPYLGNPGIFGPVTDAAYNEGAYFRAGIALFLIAGPLDHTVGGNILSEVQYGVKKTNAYTWYEDHLHFRFGEKSPRGPRGGAPYAFAVSPTSGKVFVGITNQGFGPDLSFPPDGSVPYRTVLCISSGRADASILWEADTDSYRRDWLGTGWFNDIPIQANGFPILPAPGGPEPSVNALCVDGDDNVYTGGHLNAAAGGYNIFKLRGTDGALQWRQSLGAMVYQHCIAFDPVSRLIVVVGARNHDWTGAAGRDAHLWRLDSNSGAIIDEYDLGGGGGGAVSAFGVAVSSTGRIAYCSQFVGTFP